MALEQLSIGRGTCQGRLPATGDIQPYMNYAASEFDVRQLFIHGGAVSTFESVFFCELWVCCSSVDVCGGGGFRECAGRV